MKRRIRILCILVAALVVFAMLPLQASSETNYGKVFDKLTFAKLSKYDKPLPKGGIVQSGTQIYRELEKIGNKIPGKGTVLSEKTLSFSVRKGTIDDASKRSLWEKHSGKNYYSYSEDTWLYKEGNSSTQCVLDRWKGASYDSYEWKKGATTGEHGLYGYICTIPPPPFYNPSVITYLKYKDATVLGQKCFVYSRKDKDYRVTEYNYVSYKTGITIKSVRIYSSRNYSIDITFIKKFVQKAPNNFKPPENMIWIEDRGLI